MRIASSQIVCLAAAALLLTPLTPAAQEPGFTVRIDSDLVLVHVTARDRHGNLVRDLTRQELVLLEDGRRQDILSVDYEVPRPTTATPTDLPLLASGTSLSPRLTQGARLIILFFDFTSLEPDQALRALHAARSYVLEMGAGDRVAVVTLAGQLRVQQDFTANRAALLSALANIANLSMAADNSSATDYLFSNDRRFRALREVAQELQFVPQEKTLVFFAGSVGGSVENEPQLAGTIEAAGRANMRIFGVDARGLLAGTALGDASVASASGTGVLSGRAVLAQISRGFQSKELLRALARGTGGRTFFDSNDLYEPFRRLAADRHEYYMLSYHSSNRARDGRFRRIEVRSTRPNVKLEYRTGYYSRLNWKATTKEEREQQLDQELVADLPSTDLPLFAWTAYLRVDRDHYFIPLVVLVPGSDLGTSGSARSKLALAARVYDEQGREVAEIRDAVNYDSTIHSKHLQYTSGVTVPQGKYRIRVVVRDNSTGRIGCFETSVELPPAADGFHLSPVLMGWLTTFSGRHPTPLVRGDQRLVLNPVGIFFADDNLFLRSEVYGGGTKAGEIVASIRLLKGTTLAYDSGPLPAAYAADTGAVVIEKLIPRGILHPGSYTCQLTVVDKTLRLYSLARLPLKILARQ